MSVEDLREEIEFGLSNLDKIYSRIHAFRSADVDLQILQSALTYECIGYFNAIEHLISRFLKSMRKPVPTGPTSHRDTLRLFESTLQEYSISSPGDWHKHPHLLNAMWGAQSSICSCFAECALRWVPVRTEWSRRSVTLQKIRFNLAVPLFQ